MEKVNIKAYGKINLSLDVIGKLTNGYHEIETLMQDIDIYDSVLVKASHINIGQNLINLTMSDKSLPKGIDNLAVKGALAVLDNYYGEYASFDIEIIKNLPVAAGLAGGSGNGAAVMLGINKLIGYRYSLNDLMDIGSDIGADFPFSIMMIAAKNRDEFKELKGIENADTTAIARGIGDILTVIEGLPSNLVLAKPDIHVSTREVYENIDCCLNLKRPDNKALTECIACKNYEKAYSHMENVMEEYTLKRYPEAKALKEMMENSFGADKVLMSGSGPTMVAYFSDEIKAKEVYENNKSGYHMWLTTTGIV